MIIKQQNDKLNYFKNSSLEVYSGEEVISDFKLDQMEMLGD